MALSTAKLTELPPHILSTFSFPRRKPPHFHRLLFKPFYSSLRSTKLPKTPSEKPNAPKTPSSWIKKWPSHRPPAPSPPPRSKSGSKKPEPKPESTRAGTTAIDRIVLRLRNLGLGSDNEEDEDEGEELGIGIDNADINLNDSTKVEFGDEKLGELLKRDWVRPDTFLVEDEDSDDDDALLPWERRVSEDEVTSEDNVGGKKRPMRAPTLAELTIEDAELRRLRTMGMTLRERVSVPKAGTTGAVLEKIHQKWRKCELVRLKFHEELAHDMKTAHEIVEVGEFLCWYLISNGFYF